MCGGGVFPRDSDNLRTSLNSMALTISSTASLHPNPHGGGLPSPIPRHNFLVGFCALPPFFRADTQSEEAKVGKGPEDYPSPPSSGSFSSARAQMDLLEQLTSSTSSDESNGRQ